MSHSSALLPLFPDTAEIRDGVLWIGGCSTVELAEEYGTPLVVYCEETIRNAARAWRRGAGEGTVVYGTKAFPNVPIMKILWEEGIGADVSTLGEMKYAEAAGIPPSSWVVHGNNKSDEELRFAAEQDAWLVVMDEPGEVERCVEFGVKRVLAPDHAGHRGRRPREDHDGASGVEVRRPAGGRCRRDPARAGCGAGDGRSPCAPRVAGGERRTGAGARGMAGGVVCGTTGGTRLDAGDPQPGWRSRDPLHAGRPGAPETGRIRSAP